MKWERKTWCTILSLSTLALSLLGCSTLPRVPAEIQMDYEARRAKLWQTPTRAEFEKLFPEAIAMDQPARFGESEIHHWRNQILGVAYHYKASPVSGTFHRSAKDGVVTIDIVPAPQTRWAGAESDAAQ